MIGQGLVARLAKPLCGIFDFLPRQTVDNPSFTFALLQKCQQLLFWGGFVGDSIANIELPNPLHQQPLV